MPQFVGKKVQYLRRQRRLLQVDLARHLGVSSAHINNIEADRRPASLEFIQQAAQFFGVTIDYLLQDLIAVEAVARYDSENTAQSSSVVPLFGTKLYTLRTRNSLTQSQLARQLGLRTHAHISLLESGQKDPSIELVLRIANVFRVTTDYLLRDAIPIQAISVKQ